MTVLLVSSKPLRLTSHILLVSPPKCATDFTTMLVRFCRASAILSVPRTTLLATTNGGRYIGGGMWQTRAYSGSNDEKIAAARLDLELSKLAREKAEADAAMQKTKAEADAVTRKFEIETEVTIQKGKIEVEIAKAKAGAEAAKAEVEVDTAKAKAGAEAAKAGAEAAKA